MHVFCPVILHFHMSLVYTVFHNEFVYFILSTNIHFFNIKNVILCLLHPGIGSKNETERFYHLILPVVLVILVVVVVAVVCYVIKKRRGVFTACNRVHFLSCPVMHTTYSM